MIHVYAKCSSFNDARNLFDEMPHRNIVSWTTMVSAFTNSGMPHEALKLYNEMLESKTEQPNQFLYSAVLKACGLVGNVELGKLVHDHIFQSKLDVDIVLMNALLDMYVKCGSLMDAQRVFYEIPCKNATTWNTLILGHAKQGLIGDAMKLFDKMPEPDIVSWNSIIAGLVDNASVHALQFVSMMHVKGLKLDEFTFPNALKACGLGDELMLGREIHCYIIKSGFESSCYCISALIDMYSNCKLLGEAMNIFDQFFRNSPVSESLALWNSMLSGYVANGDYVEALSLASHQRGKQVHALCLKKGYVEERVITTALIDMYAKCGDIEDALALFGCLSEIDTMSWTSIIVGCAQNGRADEAISLLHKMIESDTKPNKITILGVLTACRHAGLVEEAWDVFNSIETKHGLTPCPEHYNCMVDILGQAGRFEEAGILISEMPFKPDKTIWSSLLGACGIYKNRHLANIVAEHLLATSPEDVSVYIMLSNVYAALGMWDSLSKVREAVKKIGKKGAGKSWIEISRQSSCLRFYFMEHLHSGHVKQGLNGGVLKLIYQILEPDFVSWNSMVAAVQSEKLVIPTCYCHEVSISDIQFLHYPTKVKESLFFAAQIVKRMSSLKPQFVVSKEPRKKRHRNAIPIARELEFGQNQRNHQVSAHLLAWLISLTFSVFL
ncbi:hypothetical protein P8452_26248 [Trifolium repens]|nr:hypothetical protein P8452_26248 [Trifolium repens]